MRSNARICGYSLAGIAGLNPARGMHFVLCVVSKEKRQNTGQSGQRTKYGCSTENKRIQTKKILKDIWMSVSCEGCVIWWRSLRRADHPSRGMLPTVVCHSVRKSTKLTEIAFRRYTRTSLQSRVDWRYEINRYLFGESHETYQYIMWAKDANFKAGGTDSNHSVIKS